MRTHSANTATFCWIVAAVTALALIPFLGETLFYSKGEPREAIVAYTILESGNWTLPFNYGTDMAYKPPFLYWCIASCATLLGGLSEFTSRLPSALAFLLMQVVFFQFVARRRSVQQALVASLLLLTCFEVHRAAVACRVDMVQVCFIVIAICLLFRWDERGCRGVPWLAVLSMACATLTKGPVGSFLPCLVIGAYQLLRGRSFVKTFFSFVGIGLLTFIPYALWIWAAWHQGGEAFINLMLEENTGRLTGQMSYESHENPFWYNFLTLIWGWTPWTLLLPLALLNRRPRRTPAPRLKWMERLSNFWQDFLELPPLTRLSWVVSVLIVLFYCIPKSKRSVYLLPVYPFMALLMADYLLALAHQGARSLRILIHILSGAALLLTVAFLSVRLGLVPESLMNSGRHAAENLAYLRALRDDVLPAWKVGITLLPAAAAIASIVLMRRQELTPYRPLQAGLLTLTLFLALDSTYQPLVLSTKSERPLARRIEQMCPEGPVYSFSKMSYYGVNYYLGDRMRHIEQEPPQDEALLLVSDKEEAAMQEALTGDYSMEKLFRTDRRSCDMRSPINLYRITKK